MSNKIRIPLLGAACAVALLLAGCGDQPTPTPSVHFPVVIVQTGVMTITQLPTTPPVAQPGAPGVTLVPDTPLAVTPLPVGAPAPTTGGPLPSIGTVLTTTASVRLYAAPATAAQSIAEYPAGAAFTVLEPSGDYTTYPVVVAGEQWVRVRAADNLVGWLRAANKNSK